MARLGLRRMIGEEEVTINQKVEDGEEGEGEGSKAQRLKGSEENEKRA